MRIIKCDKCNKTVDNVYQIKYRKLHNNNTGTINRMELCEQCFNWILLSADVNTENLEKS